MNLLSTYLWKEWREQRATLAALALLIALGIAAVVAALPRSLASDPLVLQGSVAIALLAAIMSTGSDLLARERNATALRFLERLPAGLQLAFRAKLVFFAGTLAAAASLGGLVASAASLLRCGSVPQRLLEGEAPWLIALLLGVSTWVFAAAAWMPASALTFPRTVLLFAVLAWPVVLALSGDPLYQPAPIQGLAFALLCVIGAPLSAWAAFVVGSRRGGSRIRAAVAGIAVALVCFAPTWGWAAARHASVAHAPFEILHGTTGINGRYAFLDLTRRAPPGVVPETAERWNRSTALLVDLEQGTWSFPGPIDASAFLGASPALGVMLPRADEMNEPVRLVQRGESSSADAAEILFDRESARRLAADDPRARPAPRVGPREFGLASAPEGYTLRTTGAGHRLRFGAGERAVDLYRDPDGRVFDARALPRGAHGAELFDLRVRRGRWIARDGHAWVWLDPTTGTLGPLDCVRRNEWIGPMLDDGRVLVVGDSSLQLLDPEIGQRTGIAVVGDPSFGLRFVSHASGMPGDALSARSASVLYVSGERAMRFAVLDAQHGTLELGPESGGALLRVIGADSKRVLAVEDGERIVRYDFERDEREVLITIDQVR